MSSILFCLAPAHFGVRRLARREFLVSLACAAAFVALAPALIRPACAEGNAPQPFTEQAFEAAQKAGKPILVDTYATWCDVCARQAPILDKLRGEAKYKNLVTFKVNFDTQKDVMRRFNARVQSTLICFRGTKEVGRSVGETQPEWIDDLLAKTITDSTT